MTKDNLLERVKEAGFESLNNFVRANIHYLSENKQRLFYSVADIDKVDCPERRDKEHYRKGCYNGKRD